MEQPHSEAIELLPPKMPDEIDLLHSKAIGKIILDSFERDDFIDTLDRNIKYPDNAP